MTRLRRSIISVGLAFLLTSCSLPPAAGSATSSFAPTSSLSGRTLGGATISSAAIEKRPLVLIFWASWCGPCHDEQPRLNLAYSHWAPKGIQFLGVDMLDTDSAARTFVQDLHVPYPSLVDSDANIAAGFLVPAAPALVFVGAGGRVSYTALGGLEILSDQDFATAVGKITSS